MLRLNRRQRTMIADTLRQLANTVVVASVGSQFVGSRSQSIAVAITGIMTWWVLLLAALAFAGSAVCRTRSDRRGSLQDSRQSQDRQRRTGRHDAGWRPARVRRRRGLRQSFHLRTCNET